MADKENIILYNPVVPFSPYLRVSIGDEYYEMETPNFLKSFTFTKIAGYRGQFELTMTDWMDYNLEQRLVVALKRFGTYPFRFQYGYAQGARSPVYIGMILNYTPTFNADMTTTYVMNGLCDVELGSVNSKIYHSQDYNNVLSDMLGEICLEENGWQRGTPFVETDRLKTPSDFQRKNESTMPFMRQKIVPYATKNGNPVRLLHTSTNDGVKVSLVEIDPLNPKIAKRDYNFVINGGNYGTVISFTPSYTGRTLVAANMSAAGFDRNANDLFFHSNKELNDPRIPDSFPVMGGPSPEYMSQFLNNQWFEYNVGLVSATMEVIGDPDLQLLDYVNVIPLRPDGQIHHTGGTYIVFGITDNVAGTYTTSLTLKKIPRATSAKLNVTLEEGG